jgi:Ni2+-binding GTPase involved in maturation of urease and hydrogenase
MQQRIVVVAGPPAGGKTSVMIHAIGALQAKGQQVAVVKIDCLDTEDHHRYAKLNIPVVAGLSRDVCPDHFFAVNFEEMAEWARERKADLLIIETAGLCHRCAPATVKTLSICVIDCLSSVKVPQKIGPVLTTADIIVVAKGDIVSQAEREVFWHKIKQINRDAIIMEVNGITGAGNESLARLILDAPTVETVTGDTLRHSMPTAICSYCVGEIRLGNEYQQGVVEKMNFAEETEKPVCLVD